MMPEWITYRRPTVEDADINGDVWATIGASVELTCMEEVQKGEPWQPTSRPEPYEPPKPVRREWWCYLTPNGNMAGYMNDRQDQTCNIHVREVLEGDPTPEMVEDIKKHFKDLLKVREQERNAERERGDRILAELEKLRGEVK